MTEATKKKPADHKPKATPLDPDTTRKVFVSGREWSVDFALLNDWETLDIIGEIDGGNMTRAPGLLRAILGMEQYMKARPIIGHGAGSIERGSQFLGDLLKAMHEAAAPNS